MRPDTLNSIASINALPTATRPGVQTRRSNPNAPAISLEKEYGGIRIKVEDEAALPIIDELANFCTDATGVSDDGSVDVLLTPGGLYYPPDELHPQCDVVPPPELPTPPPTPEPSSTASYYTPIDASNDIIDGESNMAFAARVSAISDNPTVDEALTGFESAHWRAAMDAEYETLVRLGVFEEELYMEQIPFYTDGTNGVLRLRRSLYGLKQSGRAWNRTLDRKLKALGYFSLMSDACIYCRIRHELGVVQTAIIAVHVDDSVVITSPECTDSVVRELTTEFEMRDLGPIRHFLGIQIERCRSQRTLVLKQTAYIDSIVELAGQVNAYPLNVPMSPHTTLTRHLGTRPDYPYQTMIGKLMYAAICTRPDIAYAVTYLSQFNSCYGPPHVTAVKNVLRYLKGTSFMGLTYRRKDLDTALGEVGYADADFASSMIDRKSISGNIFMFGGAAVSWSSKKQTTVALSTMEAEYMAITQATTQALWMRRFFEELSFPSPDPTLIVSDNLAALTLTVESQFHARAKHIDIKHHFVRDAINNRLISTLYVKSSENLADAFTKALPTAQFNYLMGTVMGEQVFTDEDDYLWN